MKNPSIESSTRLLLVAFLFLLIFIGMMVLPVNAAPRGIITVTNTNDSGAGSLRDAIANANPNDTIVFSLTLPATITLSSYIGINTNINISGPGELLLSLDGNNSIRVIVIGPGAIVNLSGLTIERGNSSGYGSGITNYGILSVTNTTVLSTGLSLETAAC